MAKITDEIMREMRKSVKSYSIMILRAGPKRQQPNVEQIIWERGRRNLELRAEGKLSIVCPVTDESEVCGLCIFNTDLEETKRIMDGDPGVQARVFLYEVHPCRSFPGDSLPA
jgi:hypothetical protein